LGVCCRAGIGEELRVGPMQHLEHVVVTCLPQAFLRSVVVPDQPGRDAGALGNSPDGRSVVTFGRKVFQGRLTDLRPCGQILGRYRMVFVRRG
jgi:hypothetical protein